MTAEHIPQLVAGTGFGTGSGEVLGQEPEQPIRYQDGAPGLILGWASVQLPVVQLVQLPLDPDPTRPDVPGFQAHQLAPTDAGETLGHHCHELVIATRQQGRPLGDQQNPERGSDRLFGAAMLRPPDTPAAAASLGRRVRGRAGYAEQPAGHRDVDPVVGEFVDQPERYFGRTFSLAKYAAARLRISFSISS
jgi:hypothetical protein